VSVRQQIGATLVLATACLVLGWALRGEWSPRPVAATHPPPPAYAIAAPEFITRYVAALCATDIAYLGMHSGAGFMQFASTLRAKPWECRSTRYLGSAALASGRIAHIYVIATPRAEQWWVLTADGDTVVGIE
jgi:hypothetical protein